MLNKYSLPESVEIDGKMWPIQNQCDYRMILRCNRILTDDSLPEIERIRQVMAEFYGADYEKIVDVKKAVGSIYFVIARGEQPGESGAEPIPMNWEHDFNYIASAVNRTLGYDVRSERVTHWWTFLAALNESGETMFARIMAVRDAIQKGKTTESDREFYRYNKDAVDLPLTAEERMWLNGE